jgi:hypothetical protein
VHFLEWVQPFGPDKGAWARNMACFELRVTSIFRPQKDLFIILQFLGGNVRNIFKRCVSKYGRIGWRLERPKLDLEGNWTEFKRDCSCIKGNQLLPPSALFMNPSPNPHYITGRILGAAWQTLTPSKQLYATKWEGSNPAADRVDPPAYHSGFQRQCMLCSVQLL